MKRIYALAGVLVLACSMSSCAVQKTMQATGGSRADGTVKLSYEYGQFEQPTVDMRQVHRKAGTSPEKLTTWLDLYLAFILPPARPVPLASAGFVMAPQCLPTRTPATISLSRSPPPPSRSKLEYLAPPRQEVARRRDRLQRSLRHHRPGQQVLK
eukprot:gene20822-25010_t